MKCANGFFIFLAGCSLVLAGCDKGGGDDDSAVPAGSGGTAAGGAAATSGTSLTEEVLANKTFSLTENEWFDEFYGGVRGPGRVTVTISWAAVDLLDGSAIDISLLTEVNRANGAVRDSPYSVSISRATGEAVGVVVRNLNPGTRADGTVTVIWYAE